MPTAMPTAVAPVFKTLSSNRMKTYLDEAGGDADKAVELYAWNARITAALMVPAHFAEVSARNAVSDVLTEVYGENWPWSASFTQSLPTPKSGYKPRESLQKTRAKHSTTGKVIADMHFVFWQTMFTSRHDGRLWKPYIKSLFPQAEDMKVAELRSRISKDLDSIRVLRNRMAHHEPIFNRPLNYELPKMLDLIHLRCDITGQWVRELEEATDVLAARPF